MILSLQSKLAIKYGFGEALDNHWFNLFCAEIFEWKYKPIQIYTSRARQIDPKKRKQIEIAAMEYVIAKESIKRKCTDVSASESFDILSEDVSGGNLEYIEVKGHAGDNRTAELTYKEYLVALRERQRYILYIVYNLDTNSPQHLRIIDPLSNMDVKEKFTPRYFLK